MDTYGNKFHPKVKTSITSEIKEHLREYYQNYQNDILQFLENFLEKVSQTSKAREWDIITENENFIQSFEFITDVFSFAVSSATPDHDITWLVDHA